MNGNDVRREALGCINDHLNMGNFSSTRDQYDVFERVVYAIRQIMAIRSPESVVVCASPKAKNSKATTHVYGLMLDRLQGLSMLRDLYSSRGVQSPVMIVLKMDDACPANNAIGLVHTPTDKDSAAQGVVVWINCQMKVAVMGTGALTSFCDDSTDSPLEADQIESLLGSGFDNYIRSNLGVLIASFGMVRNNLCRAQYAEDVLAV